MNSDETVASKVRFPEPVTRLTDNPENWPSPILPLSALYRPLLGRFFVTVQGASSVLLQARAELKVPGLSAVPSKLSDKTWPVSRLSGVNDSATSSVLRSVISSRV